MENLGKIKIVPLQEPEQESFNASVFDYVSAKTMLFVDEPSRLWDLAEKIYNENKAYADELWTVQELTEACGNAKAVSLAALQHNYFSAFTQINMPVRTVAPYNRNTELLAGDLRGWLNDGIVPVIMMSSSIKARGLADTLTGKGITAEYVDAEPFLSPGRVSVISGELTAGFRFWNENWLLITESDIFGMQKRRRLHSKNKGAQLQYFRKLKPAITLSIPYTALGVILAWKTLRLTDATATTCFAVCG